MFLSYTLTAAVSTILAAGGLAQVLDPAADPTAWQSKLHFHATRAYNPGALAGAAALAGFRQATDARTGWEPGGINYGQRLGSTLVYSGIRNGLAFGLDSALHQDPRYYRSADRGVWKRTRHAFRGTILTRTDSGGETLSTWRLGSAYGGALLSNQWYPDRINTVNRSLTQGSLQIGFDLLANIGSEFWPDIKKNILRRKP